MVEQSGRPRGQAIDRRVIGETRRRALRQQVELWVAVAIGNEDRAVPGLRVAVARVAPRSKVRSIVPAI